MADLKIVACALIALFLSSCASMIKPVTISEIPTMGIFEPVLQANDLTKHANDGAQELYKSGALPNSPIAQGVMKDTSGASLLLSQVLAGQKAFDAAIKKQAQQLSVSAQEVNQLNEQVIKKDRIVLSRDKLIFWQWITIAGMGALIAGCIYFRI